MNPIRVSMLAGSLATVVLISACSEGEEPKLAFCDSPIEVIFEPGGELLLPFPSDLFLLEDPATPSGFRVHLGGANLPSGEAVFDTYPYVIDQLNQLDGFGTSADIAFGFNSEIGTREVDGGEVVVTPPPSLTVAPDQTTQPGSPAVLIEIGAAGDGEVVPLILEYVSDRSPEGHGQHFLLAEPGFPLKPRTVYALALTRNLTDSRGHCVAPSAATRSLLLGEEASGFGLLASGIPEALDTLEAGGFIQDASDLAGLTVFTTQSVGDELAAAAQELLARAADTPPVIVEGSLQVSPGSGGAALVVTGRFETPQFLGADGTFVIEDGRPVQQGSEELAFELVVPESGPEHQPPHPIVVYQHGLNGNKEQDMGAKRAQARAGFASLAIDAPLHGERASGDGLPVLEFFAIDLETGDFDMPVLRDNFRQAYLDVVWLSELVLDLAGIDLLPAGDPDGLPELAGGPVYLSGHSLGAIIACGAFALNPRITAGNLSAGGGRLTTNLFMRSELLGYFIDLLKPPGTTTADVRRFMPLLQTILERGDPVNLAGRIAREAPRHVLFQEVTDDGIVPNDANETLARALGLVHVRPVIHPVYGLEVVDEPVAGTHPGGITAAFFQFDRLADGSPAGHSDIYADPVAQAQWIHFFSAHRDAGTPEVIDPYRELQIP